MGSRRMQRSLRSCEVWKLKVSDVEGWLSPLKGSLHPRSRQSLAPLPAYQSPTRVPTGRSEDGCQSRKVCKVKPWIFKAEYQRLVRNGTVMYWLNGTMLTPQTCLKHPTVRHHDGNRQISSFSQFLLFFLNNNILSIQCSSH